MEVINGLENFPSLTKKTIITIGNFDGVHLGHQEILKFLVRETKKYGSFSLVLTFSPHPENILGTSKVKMIQTLDQRLESFQNFDVQGVLITPFDEKFSSLSSEEFTRKILRDTLKIEEIVIGENFRFGKNREGSISTLQSLGLRFGFRVHEISSVSKAGKVVSSSLIRNLLQEGRIEEANALLGRCYEIRGKVIKGKAVGRILGFPTSNLQAENEIIPLGVYISQVSIDSETLPSLTNVGTCPTFGQKEVQIESYIINFSKNLYGKEIAIRFIKKIRNEIKFRSKNNLSLQIKKDLETAKAYFRARSSP